MFGYLLEVVKLLTRVDLDSLAEINNEAQISEGIFIDWSNRIVQEHGAEKQCQQKNLSVVIVILIKSAKSFRVNYDYGKFLAAITLPVKYFFPEPEAFCAWIYGGAHLKSASLVRKIL